MNSTRNLIVLSSRNLLSKLTYLFIVLISWLVTSCATTHPQYGKDVSAPDLSVQAENEEAPMHTFFLIGDAGNADQPEASLLFEMIKKRLKRADENSTLIFLGDNIYPKGMPAKTHTAQRELAEVKLRKQIDLQKEFKGNLLFIPGNHDWYSGLEGLKAQEKYVKKHVKNKHAFLPKDGCAVDSRKINDDLTLITVDSQWYLENWDRHEGINDDCEIKTREEFYDEFEKLIIKNENTTIVVAVHHPLMSNGTHGGQYSVKKQLFPIGKTVPVPVLGSVINELRRTSGASLQDLQNRVYRGFYRRMSRIVGGRDNVVFVSGHDHNLQYLQSNIVKQIISGAGSKTEAARAINSHDFSFGGLGYAVLDVFSDGETRVRYYGETDGEEVFLFEQTVLEGNRAKEQQAMVYNPDFSSKVISQVYPDRLTRKSGFHKFLFGDHYRKLYSTPVEVDVLDITQYKGGLTPLRSGGGHQTKSLRLRTADKKQYAMRGMKKDANRTLQTIAFKSRYIGDKLEDSYLDEFLLDFFTSSNPYYPFIIGYMADPLGIYHTKSELYYVPKQPGLGNYNRNYGDELYMLEQRPMKRYKDAENFGYPDDIMSSDDFLLELSKSPKNTVDEPAFIRARLFDMLIGDWDRHPKQWKWAKKKEGNLNVFRPIPVDRDMVFPKFDGVFLEVVMRLPGLRHMQSYNKDIRNIKWFNMEPYPLDLAVLKNATLEDWLEQARYIQDNLSMEDVRFAFSQLPPEIRTEDDEEIIRLLEMRMKQLPKYAKEYYKILQKTVLVPGTVKDDKFIIERLPGGKTKVSVYLKKKEEDGPYFERTYKKGETRNIWVYGMSGEDEITVTGKSDKYIPIKIAGGTDMDSYNIENGKRIHIYDFPNQKGGLAGTRAATTFSNDYEINRYDFTKPDYNSYSGVPSASFNPDDGVALGMSFTYLVKGFNSDDFTQRHNLIANYFFATSGFELKYKGTFAKIFGSKWNFNLASRWTSPNFAINYFGMGTTSHNPQSDKGKKYNRVKIQEFSVTPSITKFGRSGSEVEIFAGFSDFKVKKSANRYIATAPDVRPEVFKHQQFFTTGFTYHYSSVDHRAVPTLGLSFDAGAYWVANLNDSKRNFPVLSASLGLTQRITKNDALVFHTMLKGKTILNNNFDFFQGVTLGGDEELRGYRNERFTGKSAFSQNLDLRVRFGTIRRVLVPMKYGIKLGYDYGRAWIDGEHSNRWHSDVGAGLWFNVVHVIDFSATYFYGTDHGRFAFTLSFGI